MNPTHIIGIASIDVLCLTHFWWDKSFLLVQINMIYHLSCWSSTLIMLGFVIFFLFEP